MDAFQSRNHNSSILSQVARSLIVRSKKGAPFIAACNKRATCRLRFMKLLVVTTASILAVIAVSYLLGT